jgi:hypothetical protein
MHCSRLAVFQSRQDLVSDGEIQYDVRRRAAQYAPASLPLACGSSTLFEVTAEPKLTEHDAERDSISGFFPPSCMSSLMFVRQVRWFAIASGVRRRR